MKTLQQITLNPDRLNALVFQVVGDVGAAMSASLVLLGDQLGLYKALATGMMLPAELAEKTATNERYVREWLANQAASGYVSYNAELGMYFMTPEQTAAFADEGSPAFMPGAFQVVSAIAHGTDRMKDNFKSGRGLNWGDQHTHLFEGTERFFRSGYKANLLSSWIPALDGVQAKLSAGGDVVDIGCGLGASTILMAAAFPNSDFLGIDFHPASIESARKRAAEAGLTNARFEIAKATDFPGGDFDFACCFDCLHDMGDPASAAQHVRQTLAPDGTWMIVEPMAADDVQGNLNPVGRVFYAASTMLCVPNSLAGEGAALGAQAGEKRLTQVIKQGGFTRVRRAAETPFNMILEAKP
jgi:SAM-dependent methyltransferase